MGRSPAGLYAALHNHNPKIGLGIQVPSIAENSKGEDDLGDDVEMNRQRINESQVEEESQENEGSDVEPPEHDELSQ